MNAHRWSTIPQSKIKPVGKRLPTPTTLDGYLTLAARLSCQYRRPYYVERDEVAKTMVVSDTLTYSEQPYFMADSHIILYFK